MKDTPKIRDRSKILALFVLFFILGLSGYYKAKVGIIGLAILWGLVLICMSLLTLHVLWLFVISLTLGLAYLWIHYPLSYHLALTISQSSDLTEELLALYVAATAVAVLIRELRLKSIRLQQKELQTSVLYELARKLSGISSFAEGLELLSNTLHLQGFSETALYIGKAEQQEFLLHDLSSYLPSQSEKQESELVLNTAEKARRFQKNSFHHHICALLGFKERLGYIIIADESASSLRADQFPFLEALIDQFAIALERELLREKSHGIALMSKTQTLYKTLLNSVSHELKTPLATITGSASAILDPLIQTHPERSSALAHEILIASQRLTEVLDKLLDMSRIDSGTLQPKLEKVDLRDLVALTCQRISFEVPEPIFSVSCDTENPCVRGDPVLISQALYYILQNGLRYGPPKGPLSIYIDESVSEITVSVRDRGPGVPMEFADKIFDKFYRGKPQKTGGLGLGLSIAHGFIEVHGGRISVQNHPEGGAIFTLFIPKRDPH